MMKQYVLQNFENLIPCEKCQNKYLRIFILLSILGICLYILINNFGNLYAGDAFNPSFVKPNANGFNLSYCLISKINILSGGPLKDGIPALVSPPVVHAKQVNYLDPYDRVIGVTMGNEARAYPLDIIIWHEAINDTLNGIPILVTYCPLCDSALVFHREIGGIVKEFGVSGLLYQSNVLLYDRQQNSKNESLWSQLSMRAVCGPAAQKRHQLELIDSNLITFQAWTDLYPETTVVSIATGYNRSYDQTAYAEYFSTDNLVFPVVNRTRGRPDLKNKDQVMLVMSNGEYKAYALPDIIRSPNQQIEDFIAGVPLQIRLNSETYDVIVQPIQNIHDQGDSSFDIKRSYMFWFAFDAFYPEVELYQP